MKTTAQQLKIKKFPFIIRDDDGNRIYYEEEDGYWYKREYQDGKQSYFEDSSGYWRKIVYKEGRKISLEDSDGYYRQYNRSDGNVSDDQITLNTINDDGNVRDDQITLNTVNDDDKIEEAWNILKHLVKLENEFKQDSEKLNKLLGE